MNCKEPFLELAKVKRTCKEKQEKVNERLMGKNDKDVETEQASTKTNPIIMHDSYRVISSNYLIKLPMSKYIYSRNQRTKKRYHQKVLCKHTNLL